MAELNDNVNPFTSNRVVFRVESELLSHLHPHYDPVRNELVWELPETAERRRLGAEPFIKPMGRAAAPVPTVQMHEDGSATVYSAGSLKDMLSGIVADSSVPPGMVVFRDEFGEVVRMLDTRTGEPVRVSQISTETLEETAARTARAPWNDVPAIADDAIRALEKVADFTDVERRNLWGTTPRPTARDVYASRVDRVPDFLHQRWFTEGVILLDRLRTAGFKDEVLSWLLPPEILGVRHLPMAASIVGIKVTIVPGVAPHLAFVLPTGADR